MVGENELDLSLLGGYTPSGVKEQYRKLVPEVLKANPSCAGLQDAFMLIQAKEQEYGSRLFGVNLSEQAHPLYALTFNRKLLKLKTDLGIISAQGKHELEDIESVFSDAASRLSGIRGIPVAEADGILMGVFQFQGLKDANDAVERLTNGPVILGFDKKDPSVFNFSNEEIKQMLESSFGLDAIVRSRLLEISSLKGFPVRCLDVEYGNSCIKAYGAHWEGEYLVLPDKETYEKVEVQLEGVSDPSLLQHLYKLRASASTAQGYATIKIRQFAAEQPSQFDYLQRLDMPEEDKMKAYFLGIIAHETVHAMADYALDKSVLDSYCSLAENEHPFALPHKFVSLYVERHNTIYNSSKKDTLHEDFAETVRIYLTNSGFLKQHFPERFSFIRQNLSFVKENAIQKIAGARFDSHSSGSQ